MYWLKAYYKLLITHYKLPYFKEHCIVLLLNFIKFLNDFKYLIKAIVHKLIGFTFKVFIAYENSVIRINIRNMVW